MYWLFSYHKRSNTDPKGSDSSWSWDGYTFGYVPNLLGYHRSPDFSGHRESHIGNNPWVTGHVGRSAARNPWSWQAARTPGNSVYIYIYMRVCTYRFSLGLFIISATIILNIIYIYIYDLHYIPTLSFSTLTNWEGDVLSTKSPELHRTTAPCGTYPSHFQKTHLNPSIILAMVKPGSPLPTSIAWFISRLILCKGAEPQNHCRGLHPLLASVKTGQPMKVLDGLAPDQTKYMNQLLRSIHEVHLKQRLIWPFTEFNESTFMKHTWSTP